MPQVKPMIECCFQYLYFSKSMQFGFRTDLPFVILSCVSNYASNNYQILVQSVRQSKKIVLQYLSRTKMVFCSFSTEIEGAEYCFNGFGFRPDNSNSSNNNHWICSTFLNPPSSSFVLFSFLSFELI